MAEKSVFISYHRDSEAGSGLARSLELALDKRGYDVFLDVDSIAAGRWSPQIEKELPRRRHFLFILTPGVLERCASPTNWMRREYDLAVESKRNIVPVRSAGFDDALERSRCPRAMQGIFEWQMARVGFETFKKDFPEFAERFLERPAAKTEVEVGSGLKRSRAWATKARLSLVVGGLVFVGWLVLRGMWPGEEPGRGSPESEITFLPEPVPSPPPPAGEQAIAPPVQEADVPDVMAGNEGSESSEEPAPKQVAKPPAEAGSNPLGRIFGAPAPADPRPGPGELWVSPSGIRFRFVPGGTYWIGSPAAGEPGGPKPGRGSEETRHQVELSRGFWMAETELTQEQWKKLHPRNPSKFTACGDDCPVETVSWYEAVGLANELSKREGVEQCYRLSCSGEMSTGGYTCTSVDLVGLECAGYRLPTETEWEVAARAGTEAAPELAGIAWYRGNSRGKPHPVRGRPANGWGLHDMLGNVYEWVWDWKDDYPSGLVKDPVGSAGGSFRVLRGGSWDSDPQVVRAACRLWIDPFARSSSLGFRLARGQGRGAPSAEPQE